MQELEALDEHSKLSVHFTSPASDAIIISLMYSKSLQVNFEKAASFFCCYTYSTVLYFVQRKRHSI